MTISSTRQWLVFFSCSLLLLLMNIDMTAVNLALAAIAADLRLDIVNVQWVISAYFIGGAALVMLGGLLGDAFGHKKIFLLGASIFTLASLAVGFSNSEWTIIATRLLQGFGAALAWPLAIVIVRETFVGRETFVMGLITAVMACSMSIGPPLGGLILHFLNWRWIFFINIPLGLLAIGFAYGSLTKNNHLPATKDLHLPSASLLVLGLLLLIFSLSEAPRFGLLSAIIFSTFLGGLLLIGIFIILQKKIKNPLIDLHLFHNQALSSCFIMRFFWQAMFTAFFLILSLWLQNILGYSVLTTSLYFLTITLAFAVASIFTGRLNSIFSARLLIITALSSYIVTFAALLLIKVANSTTVTLLILMLFGLGTGIGFPSLLNSTLALAPANRRGMVSGVLYAMLFFGGSIGAIFTGSTISKLAQHYLMQQLIKLNIFFSPSTIKSLTAAATGVHKLAKLTALFPHEQAGLMVHIAQRSFAYAFNIILLVFILLCTINILLAQKIKEV